MNINEFQKEYDEYTHKLGIVKSNTQVIYVRQMKRILNQIYRTTYGLIMEQ